jgi:outer membrane murein-binding lipoprotein Lpp
MNSRRGIAAALLTCTLAIGGIACSSSEKESSGATTNLDELGPEVAKLRLEVQQLREEVRVLREAIAQGTTTTSLPGE